MNKINKITEERDMRTKEFMKHFTVRKSIAMKMR